MLNTNEGLQLNKDISYVNLALAIKVVGKEALKLGIIRETQDVTRLIVNEGVYLGVEVGRNRIIARKTIVAAGPQTPRLLESSKVKFPDDFFTIASVRVATISLYKAEFYKIKSILILIIENGISYLIY